MDKTGFAETILPDISHYTPTSTDRTMQSASSGSGGSGSSGYVDVSRFVECCHSTSSSGGSSSNYVDVSEFVQCFQSGGQPKSLSSNCHVLENGNSENNSMKCTLPASYRLHENAVNNKGLLACATNSGVGLDDMSWIDDIINTPATVSDSALVSELKAISKYKAESPSKPCISYCPDFSDIYDESYSFWKISEKDDCKENRSITRPEDPRHVPLPFSEDVGRELHRQNEICDYLMSEKTSESTCAENKDELEQYTSEFSSESSTFLTEETSETEVSDQPLSNGRGTLPSISAAFSLKPYAFWLDENGGLRLKQPEFENCEIVSAMDYSGSEQHTNTYGANEPEFWDEHLSCSEGNTVSSHTIQTDEMVIDNGVLPECGNLPNAPENALHTSDFSYAAGLDEQDPFRTDKAESVVECVNGFCTPLSGNCIAVGNQALTAVTTTDPEEPCNVYAKTSSVSVEDDVFASVNVTEDHINSSLQEVTTQLCNGKQQSNFPTDINQSATKLVSRQSTPESAATLPYRSLLLPKGLTTLDPNNHSLILLSSGENKYLLFHKNQQVVLPKESAVNPSLQVVGTMNACAQTRESERTEQQFVSQNLITTSTEQSSPEYVFSTTNPNEAVTTLKHLVTTVNSVKPITRTTQQTSASVLGVVQTPSSSDGNLRIQYVIAPASFASATSGDVGISSKIQNSAAKSLSSLATTGNTIRLLPSRVTPGRPSKLPLNALQKRVSSHDGITASNVVSKTVYPRCKTVRQLLDERRHKKLFGCVSHQSINGRELKITAVSPAHLVRPLTVMENTTNTHSSPSKAKKPSILILHPDNGSNASVTSTCNACFETASSSTSTTVSSCQETWTSSTSGGLSTVASNPYDAFFRSVNEEKLMEEDVDNPSLSPCQDAESPSLPPFRFGRVDAREHRPRHYELLHLEIGNFKIHFHDGGKSLSRLKVVFTKRQFVYEFPVESAHALNDLKHFACIVVPFKTITAISCGEQEVKIQVNCMPQMFLGSRQQRIGIVSSLTVFDTSSPVDVTGGEASRCPTHTLLLRRNQACKLKTYLWNFDQRFKFLTSLPVDENAVMPSDSLLPLSVEGSGTPSGKKSAKKGCAKVGIRQPPQTDTAENVPPVQVCSCRVSCRSLRCSCVKAAQKCSPGRSICVCSNCDNPLNILDSIGIDPDLAVRDSCLFHNIYSIEHLRRYLCQEMVLPCCNVVATVQECIPSTVLCPNTDCTEAVQYSWCRKVLCLAERNPRNHCSECGQCCFSIGKHCQKCNACYTTRHRTLSCPRCTDVTTSEGSELSQEKFEPATKSKALSALFTLNTSITVTDVRPLSPDSTTDACFSDAVNMFLEE